MLENADVGQKEPILKLADISTEDGYSIGYSDIAGIPYMDSTIILNKSSAIFGPNRETGFIQAEPNMGQVFFSSLDKVPPVK